MLKVIKKSLKLKPTLVKQVIRLPETINSKSLTEVKIIEHNETAFFLL